MLLGKRRFSPSAWLAAGTLLFGAIVAGCSGGGHSALPPTPSSIGQIATGTKSGTLSIKIQLPSAGSMTTSSVKRSPQYVSGATQGVYITGTCIAGGGSQTQNCTGASFPPVYADVSSSSPLCTGTPRTCNLSANPVAGYGYSITVAAVDSKPTGSAGGYGTGFATTANMLAVGSQPPPLPAATGSPAPSPTPTNLGNFINRGGVNSISIGLNAIATQFVQVNPVTDGATDNVIVGTASGSYQYPSFFISAGDTAGNLIAAPSCMNTYAGENGNGAGATINNPSYPSVVAPPSNCDSFAGPDGKEYAPTITSSAPTHLCTVALTLSPGATPPPCGSAGMPATAYFVGDFAPISQALGVWTQAPPGVLNTTSLYWDGTAANDTCSGTTPKCGVPIPIAMSNAIPTTATPIIGKTTTYNVTNAAQFELAPFVSVVSCGTNPGCSATQTSTGCIQACPQISLSNGTSATATVYLYGSGGTNNLATTSGCYTTKCFAVGLNSTGTGANTSQCYTGVNPNSGINYGSPGCNVVADPAAGTTYPTGTADCLAPQGSSNAGTVIALIKPGTFTKGSTTAPGTADSMTFTVTAVSGSVTGYCNFQIADPNRNPYAYSLAIGVQVSSTGTVITVPPIQIFPPPAAGSTLAYMPAGAAGYEVLSPAGIVNTIPIVGGASNIGIDDSGYIYVLGDTPTSGSTLLAKYALNSTTPITSYQPSVPNPLFDYVSGAGELTSVGLTTNAQTQVSTWVTDVWDAGSPGGPPSRTITYPTGVFTYMGHNGTIYVPYYPSGTPYSGPLAFDLYPPGAASPTATLTDDLVPSGSVFNANYAAVASDGTFYVTEWSYAPGDSQAGLYVFPPGGPETRQLIGTAASPLGPQGVDVDGSGNVYVVNNNSIADYSNYPTVTISPDTAHSIFEYSPHAAAKIKTITGAWQSAFPLTAGSDGSIYFSCFGNGNGQVYGTYYLAPGSSTPVQVSPAAGNMIILYNGKVATTYVQRSASALAADGLSVGGGLGPRLHRH